MHLAASIAIFLVLTAVALPATVACLYLLMLTLLSARNQRPAASSRRMFFDIIVPAHNEESGIGQTVSSLQAIDWPAERYRIVVVADNCTDATAATARAAGATVLERHDLTLRGKGYALAHAFAWSRAEKRAEALVVVDADSVVSSNLLEAFAARIEGGDCALQVHYGVRNAMASWRTRLMAIALGAIHKVRSRAREFLGLSCGIRGNGWCVTHELLDKIPYKSFSLTEDVEFGVELGLAGYRVAYCDEADVAGEMVTGEQASRSQRQRWESGRLALIRSMVPSLLGASITSGSLVCLDLALDLLVLPLSYVVLNVLAILLIGAFDPAGSRALLLSVGLFDAFAIALYVCRGWQLSGVGIAGAWDLMRVPGFLVWKLLVVRLQRKPSTWIRTKRE